MKVLITGANGYIGARLCQFLSNKGHQIIAACKSPVSNKIGWSDKINNIIIGDLLIDEHINELLETKPDILIHLVSLDQKSSENSIEKTLDVNVKITWKLLENFSKQRLKKFIYFSTIQVNNLLNKKRRKINKYGDKNHYALTHLMCESICKYYNNFTKINCVCIRLSNSYGEPVFDNSKIWKLVINDLVRTAHLENKILIESDGSPVRIFIHFSEICEGIEKIIQGDKEQFKDFISLVPNNYYSILEIAKIIQTVYKNLYGFDLPIFTNKNKKYLEEKEVTSLKNNKNFVNKTISRKESDEKLKKEIENLFYYLSNQNKQ